MNSLLDMFLLPKGVYKRLNEKELSLYLGVAFIGGVDIIYPQITSNLSRLFIGKPQGVLFANILITIGLILLVGFIDAAFFTIPLADLFNKVFKKEADPQSVSIIKLMKVYIIAHLMTLPANALLYYVFDAMGLENNMVFAYLAGYLAIFVLIWFNAIISRGINSVYNFGPVFKTLVFPVVFTWNILLGIGLQYMIDNWVMRLFL